MVLCETEGVAEVKGGVGRGRVLLFEAEDVAEVKGGVERGHAIDFKVWLTSPSHRHQRRHVSLGVRHTPRHAHVCRRESSAMAEVEGGARHSKFLTNFLWNLFLQQLLAESLNPPLFHVFFFLIQVKIFQRIPFRFFHPRRLFFSS